ncbi:unannotated protein [freshwater metagenome]|uniref:Unannotated protein n=1 Tax=freshwater metagenome TaxID=449393 RepID=A0A6J6U039_9ZZZZ
MGYRSSVHATGAMRRRTCGIAYFVTHGDYRFRYGKAMHSTRLCPPRLGHIDLPVFALIGVA